MTEQIDIVTDNWVLRSDPPAWLSSGKYLLQCNDPYFHVIFDMVAGPSEASPNITLWKRGESESSATINATYLPEEIVEALTTVPKFEREEKHD